MTSSPPSTRRASDSDERGAALMIALMMTTLLSALVGALILMTATETAISVNYRTAQQTLYAADAGIERTMQDLLDEPSWSAVLSGQTTSPFSGPTTTPTLPDGTRIDLDAETAALQQGTDTAAVWTVDDPRWRLYAHGALRDMLPAGEIGSASYVAVWVGDDGADDDGNPQRDSNSILALTATAFGPFNSRRTVEATVARTSRIVTEQGLTGQRGFDAGNRSARDEGVGAAGQTLARSSLSTTTGGMGP